VGNFAVGTVEAELCFDALDFVERFFGGGPQGGFVVP
jgi:hypothetical protein